MAVRSFVTTFLVLLFAWQMTGLSCLGEPAGILPVHGGGAAVSSVERGAGGSALQPALSGGDCPCHAAVALPALGTPSSAAAWRMSTAVERSPAPFPDADLLTPPPLA